MPGVKWGPILIWAVKRQALARPHLRGVRGPLFAALPHGITQTSLQPFATLDFHTEDMLFSYAVTG